MTTQADLPKLFETAAALITQDMVNQLGYLRDRWQDEKEYEDFEDYKTAAAKVFTGDLKMLSITKTFKVRVQHVPSAICLDVKVGQRVTISLV